MANFAKVENNTVTQLIVVDNDNIGEPGLGFPETESIGKKYIADIGISGEWFQFSFNTLNGIHYGPDGQPDGGVAIRRNRAEIGSTFDPYAGEYGEFSDIPIPEVVVDQDL